MRKSVQRFSIVAVALLLFIAAFFIATEMARPLGPPADALVLVRTRTGHEVQLDAAQAREITGVMRRRASFSSGVQGTLPEGFLLIDGRTYPWRGRAIFVGDEGQRHWYWRDDRIGEILHAALGEPWPPHQ